MIHEEIVTYEVAKLAKEKGLSQCPNENGKCRIYTLDKSKNTYVLCDWTVWISAPWASEVIAAPTQSLLQRWLREEKNIHISIEYEWVEGFDCWPFWAYIKKVKDERVIDDAIKSGFNTYELALEDALAYSLKNLV